MENQSDAAADEFIQTKSSSLTISIVTTPKRHAVAVALVEEEQDSEICPAIIVK